MKRLITIPFLFIYLILSATEYYVKNGGNDASSGLNDANAWAHHPWMSTWTAAPKSLSAGDIVYMKKGNTWSIASPVSAYMTVAQSGTAGNYITTTSYSTGDRPHIMITTNTDQDIITASGKSWLKFIGLHLEHNNGAYTGNSTDGFYFDGSSSPCHHIVIMDCEIEEIPYCPIRTYINSYRITVGDTTATEIATISSYSNHIHNFGYSSTMLLGCNPADDKSYFKVYYNYIHDSTRPIPGENSYGISFGVNSTSHGWPQQVIARYNNIQDIVNWEGIDAHGGSYIYVLDNYIYNTRNGIWIGGTSTGSFTPLSDHFYIERNIVENPSSAGSAVGTFLDIGSTANPVTSSYVLDNEIFYTSRPSSGLKDGLRIWNCDGITISGNKIYNGATVAGGGGFQFNDAIAGCKNITFTQNFIRQWGPAIEIERGAYITGIINITENIITKPPSYTILISTSNLSLTADVRLYNNVFLGDTYSYIFYTAYGISSGGSFIAKNNIFGRASSGAITYWRWGGTASGFTSDYNIYWNTTTSSPFYISGSARTLAQWKSLGYDTHSPNSTETLNPLFVNASGSYTEDTDFKLQSGSPAINAGTNVGLVTDYFGNAIDSYPDIGVHEAGGMATVTTTVASAITTTTASSGGNVIDDGGYVVTARGVCWSQSANPTTANSHTTDGTGEGVFISSLTGLSPGTYYYVRAYATNSAGTAYGGTVNFTTSSSTPIVTTSAIYAITTTTASGGGDVISSGGATVTARGVCWDTSTNPDITDDKTSDGTGTGNFVSSITGLLPNTLYYLRAYATNTNGTSYGDNVLFTTLTTPASGWLYLIKDNKYLMKGSKFLTK